MLAFLALSFIAVRVLAGPVAPGPSIETRTMDEIYRAALEESGTLRVAWGGDTKLSQEGIVRAFRASFPRIKLNLSVDVSKYWDSNIERTYQTTDGKTGGVDVAVLQTLHDFTRWKEEGRLLPYKVAPWNDIYPQFVDRDGAYTGYAIFTFGDIVYQPKKVASSSLPTTYPGFLQTKWSEKLALTYPNDDDAVLYLFSLIIDKYGWDFMDSLTKERVKWVRGTATPAALISDNSTSLEASFASSSVSIKDVQSQRPNDVYMAWPQTAAIFKYTTLPETSKLFMNFLLSNQWQNMVGGSGFATRKSLDHKGVFSQKPHMDPLGYGEFMSDRQKVEAWRFQFESLLGPPQGGDPAFIM